MSGQIDGRTGKSTTLMLIQNIYLYFMGSEMSPKERCKLINPLLLARITITSEGYKNDLNGQC